MSDWAPATVGAAAAADASGQVMPLVGLHHLAADTQVMAELFAQKAVELG